jgi:putative membrane protein
MKPINKDLILREKLAIQRTHLANQTTFLAYVRTSMYFMIAGLSIHPILDTKSSFFWQYIFIGISILIVLAGISNYFYQLKKIKRCNLQVGNIKIDYLEED